MKTIKKGINIFTIILLISALLLPNTYAAVTENKTEIRVYVNGAKVSFPDQKPYINADNRTLVPVRFISEELGAGVEWIAAGNEVKIAHNSETIHLQIGSNKAVVGTTQVNLDTAPVVVNSRTMVPLRFVSECLEAEVTWNSKAGEIIISTEGSVKPFVGQPFKPSDLPMKSGSVIWGANKPTARIQYVKPSDLPIKLGSDILYSLSIDQGYITVKQYTETTAPMGLYMVIDGKLERGRHYLSDYQLTSLFAYKYPVFSALENALGESKVDITKVSYFAFDFWDETGFAMLVIENPAYQGR